jgi:lipopolysaccharide transport system ATP-binding protein
MMGNTLDSTTPPSGESSSSATTSDSDVVISVRDVGKMYRLYNHPQDRLKEQLLWRFGKHFGLEFWALRNVSFEVRRGETVGIIGRNGSGKSTLLQIIAGTLTPTAGEVHVAGRVAALLELGSGFNPEFTGRENVLLNGSILGVTSDEMDTRFEEIAAFADIGEFINQPVKLYSSGMAVRLAFAVQAIVQKDVLIVDEALAVGDEAFQRKCMRTLEDFRDAGGTVLLVSHSAQTIVRQCERCVFLHGGQLILDGPSKAVTDIYQRFIYGTPQQQQETLGFLRGKHSAPIEILLESIAPHTVDSTAAPSEPWTQPTTTFDPAISRAPEITYGSGEAEIFDFGMYDESDNLINVLIVGYTCTWRYRVRFLQTVYNVSFGMMIKTFDGIDVSGVNSEFERMTHRIIESGAVMEVNFRLRANVAPGLYYLNAGVTGELVDGATERGYLHRRVDVWAVRVIPPDTRTIYGLSYLEPHIEVRYI